MAGGSITPRINLGEFPQGRRVPCQAIDKSRQNKTPAPAPIRPPPPLHPNTSQLSSPRPRVQ